MKRNSLLLTILTLASLAAYAGEAKTPGPVDAAAAFERLKTLVGEWQADTGAMGRARVSYELVAGGTVLVERETGEKIEPMLTVYHLDGNRLLLTHYCMAGNQPRMQARAFRPDAGELEFQFLDATNLAAPTVAERRQAAAHASVKRPTAGHMRNARFRFVDQNHLESQWEFYENGKQKSVETARYTRVQ